MTIAADTTSVLPDALLVTLDGAGGGHARALAATDADAAPAGEGFVWLHLRREATGTRERLLALGLDTVIVEALLAAETRPRCTVHGAGAVVVLRGVNGDAAAAPADSVSVRLWIEGRRVIGVWRRPLRATDDVLAALERGRGPQSVGDFVARLATRLAARAEAVVVALAETADTLEARVLGGASGDSRGGQRHALAALRRRVIAQHRHVLPQRDALETLEAEPLEWLSESDRGRLREAAERVGRLAAELDAVRDRALIVRDELADADRETMNRTMLLLAVVTAIFLPLGLVTGLLGMNVGGVPGAQREGAFWAVVALMLAIALGATLLIARIGMFGRRRAARRETAGDG